MIERYLQATCDACGWTEESGPQESQKAFRTGTLVGWHYRGQQDICNGCWDVGVRWIDLS